LNLTGEGTELIKKFESQFKAFKGLALDFKLHPAKWATFLCESNSRLPIPDNFPEWSELHTLLLVKVFKPYQFPSSLAALAENLS
jgi:hypothetical protein